MAGGEERVVGGDEVLHSAAALRAALHLGRVIEPADLAHQILQNSTVQYSTVQYSKVAAACGWTLIMIVRAGDQVW